MGKIINILKINVLALVAIPLLLLATACKLIAKSMEKIPLFIGLAIASAFILSMASFESTTESIFKVIAYIIAILIFFGVVVVILFWIFSLISGLAMLAWTLIMTCFNSLYDLCYTGYFSLYIACESDYQVLSLNGKKALNGLICPFYSILRGLSWIITTLVSLMLPAAVVFSIGLVLLTLFDLNSNTKAAFGLNLIQFAKKSPTASVIGGIFIYLSVMAIAITAIMAFALEWYEWAQDLKMSGETISNDISRLQDAELQMASGRPDEIGNHLEYLNTIEEHLNQLDSLGQKVQNILEKKESPQLRSNWGSYMRNLEYLVGQCSEKNGITVEQLKKMIPQIQQLDKQRQDVRKLTDRLSEELRNPAGSSVFFAGCDTPEKLEKRYKSLCKTYHPDTGDGDTQTFQKMKDEYEAIKAAYNENSQA